MTERRNDEKPPTTRPALPEGERVQIEEAARQAATDFPPMTGDLVAAVRRSLRDHTAA